MKTMMKTMMKSAARAIPWIILCLPILLGGCFGLSRGAPMQQHYVLGASGQTEPVALAEPPTADATVIGLRPPRLAEYLASPFIVVRRGTHRIELSEFHRWGEDLARGISRTLAGHLATRSPAHHLESAPWPANSRPAYLIQLHLLRFEGVAPEDPQDPTGEAHLSAAWEIIRSGDGAVLASGTTEARSREWTVGDYDGLVALLDAGLGTLADEIALELERATPSAGDGPDPP